MTGLLLLTALISAGTIGALLHRIDYLETELDARRRWDTSRRCRNGQ